MLQRLEIESDQYGTPESIGENISYAFSLGLKAVEPSLCVHDGTWVIVGSGPTLKDHVEEIREEAKTRPICAVKGAYDFLVENGIIPEFYLSVEPQIRLVKNPHKDSTFLLASRCDPEMFKHLKEYNIVVWHAWGNDDENCFLENCFAYGGGPTSGVRAISIGYAIGFRNFHLYGMDSCLIDNEKRLGQGEIADTVKTIPVIVNSKKYVCTMAMADQANNFQELYSFLPDVHIESFGPGLISGILEGRKAAGLSV